MLNPIEKLDDLLVDYASPKARRLIHGLLALAVALVGVYLAANGDWKETLLAIGALLYAYANKANTDPIPPQPVDLHDLQRWEEQPTHVDDIVPRTTEHDESDLYGDGADRGGEVSGNPIPVIDQPERPVNPPNRGW